MMKKQVHGINGNEVKPSFVEPVKVMCKALYAVNTNIDYFPTNFVVQEDQLFYVDYECNDYMEEWNFENFSISTCHPFFSVAESI